MTEKTELIWHGSDERPKSEGWYLCKIVDLLNFTEPYEYGEPYYYVEWFDVYWDCDGIVVAWAEIPECKIELE